jgi:putative addiction module killer protein
MGPGYRVYFGIDENEVVLLGGGDKRTQVSDIRKAKECWEDYNA